MARSGQPCLMSLTLGTISPWGDILHRVRTGGTAFEHQFGTTYFGYLAQHPESDRVFNDSMTGLTTQFVSAIVDAYDFSQFRTVVDVGGSYGTLLAAILQSNPAVRGILLHPFAFRAKTPFPNFFWGSPAPS
jgi:hypothetical protein